MLIKSSQTLDDDSKTAYLFRIEKENARNTLRKSLSFHDELQVLAVLDPVSLANQCKKGFIKKQVINSDDFRCYVNPNPRGNSLCSLGLNKSDGELIYSNSENARFTSKNRLTNLILANSDFRYFFTGTLDPKKWNRSDFPTFYKSFKRFLHHKKIKYILVPEYHKDGKSIHLHGVFNESIEPYLAEFNLKNKLPKYITDGIKQGRQIKNFPDYQKRFGYVSIEKIKNLEAVAHYITKYVSKSFDDPESRVSYNRYFCSLGLNRPFFDIPTESDFSNFEPVYFSDKLTKVYYRRKNTECGLKDGASVASPSNSVKPHGVRQEPAGGARPALVC